MKVNNYPIRHDIGQPSSRIRHDHLASSSSANGTPEACVFRTAKWILQGALSVCAGALIGCAGMSHTHSDITQQPFGKTEDGTEVLLFTLRNAKGVEARISNYGGIVVSLKVPDRHGKLGDVVLGYDHLDGYLKETPYFGALIGRYGNRIARGKFTLDGKEYTLATNNYPNALHGGIKGFDKVVWQPTILANGPALKLTYLSKDGEEG